MPSPSTPPRQRSSSVHTLKYTHSQRVISCRGHNRSHSEVAGQTLTPEQTLCNTQAVSDTEVQPGSLQQPSPEPALSASLVPFTSRPPSPCPSSDPSPQLDDADEEVSRINSSVHTHSQTQIFLGSSDRGRRCSPSRGEHRSRLSQSVSPVPGGSRRQRMSPPPGDEPVTTATQLMDNSVGLSRRTLSFDSTSLSPHLPEASSVDD